MKEEHFGKGRRITLLGKIDGEDKLSSLGTATIDKFGEVIHYTDSYDFRIYRQFCYCLRNSQLAFD